MQIRPEQIAEMQALQRLEYSRRLLRSLREKSSDLTARFDDPTLLVLIGRSVEKARAYGLERGNAVEAFVMMSVLVHENFDQDPAVQKYLRSSLLNPDFKMQLLASMVARALREKVE